MFSASVFRSAFLGGGDCEPGSQPRGGRPAGARKEPLKVMANPLNHDETQYENDFYVPRLRQSYL